MQNLSLLTCHLSLIPNLYRINLKSALEFYETISLNVCGTITLIPPNRCPFSRIPARDHQVFSYNRRRCICSRRS